MVQINERFQMTVGSDILIPDRSWRGMHNMWRKRVRTMPSLCVLLLHCLAQGPLTDALSVLAARIIVRVLSGASVFMQFVNGTFKTGCQRCSLVRFSSFQAVEYSLRVHQARSKRERLSSSYLSLS